MMSFKKAIPRRKFLRGVGAAVALPLLDSMVPAFAAPGDPLASPVVRMGFMYVPNGIIMDQWTPASEGANFEMTPILEPLARVRDRLLVLTGLDQKPALALPGEGGGGPHSRATSAFLTGVHSKPSEGAEVRAGISVDQVAAKELGKKTQLASLEMSLDHVEASGICEPGYACTYRNTLAWRGPTTPLPMENQPREVFERMFGDSDTTNIAARLVRFRQKQSLLDFVSDDIKDLNKIVGPSDQNKLNEFLDAIRDIERRIQIAEEQSAKEVPTVDRPAGIPESFEDYIKLMFDLQVLAYQTDLTRVITFMIGHEESQRTYPEIGVPDAHHPISHNRGDRAMMAKVVKVNTFHIKMFAYFLEKLRATPDGNGSLLDHAMIVYGAGMSDGNTHTNINLPVLLAGAGAGKIQSGRHLRYPAGTPMTNLYMSMLDVGGVPVEQFGDSAGKLQFLSGV